MSRKYRLFCNMGCGQCGSAASHSFLPTTNPAQTKLASKAVGARLSRVGYVGNVSVPMDTILKHSITHLHWDDCPVIRDGEIISGYLRECL